MKVYNINFRHIKNTINQGKLSIHLNYQKLNLKVWESPSLFKNFNELERIKMELMGEKRFTIRYIGNVRRLMLIGRINSQYLMKSAVSFILSVNAYIQSLPLQLLY